METKTQARPETKKAALARAREAAIDKLRKLLPPGSTVYTILRHVARSGMMRRLDVYALDTDSEGKPWMRYLSGIVSHATGLRFSAKGGAREDCGIVMNGCGYSQADEIVDRIEESIGLPANALRREKL